MRKIFIILLAVFTAGGSSAQEAEDTLVASEYIETEGQIITRQKGDFGEEVYLYSGFYHQTKKAFGYGIEVGTTSETNYINPLIFFSYKTGKKENVFEWGIGPEVDYAVRGTSKPALGASIYGLISLNSKKIEDRLNAFANLYYSKEYRLWHMASVMVRPFNRLHWLQVGMHSQTDAVTGPRLSGSLGPFVMWFATDPKERRHLIGMKFSIERTKKS